MNKSLIIVAAAVVAVLFSKSKAERSANITLDPADLDLLITKIKTDTELQQKLRGPSGSSAVAGKARIRKATAKSSFGATYNAGTDAFSGGGMSTSSFQEANGFASKGDVFLRIYPVGAGTLTLTSFTENQAMVELSGPDVYVPTNHAYWTRITALGAPGPHIEFKLGGLVGKTGVGPHEFLPGIFLGFNFGDFEGEVGDTIGLRYVVSGDGVEAAEFQETAIVTAP